MLSFQEFFAACAGNWVTERTYHNMLNGEVERSHTKFRVGALNSEEKQRILAGASPKLGPFEGLKVDMAAFASPEKSDLEEFANTLESAAEPISCPGFSIDFETRSETGEEVSMSLKALFLPDAYVVLESPNYALPPLPPAAQVNADANQDLIQGFYLRDQGYSEAGAIAGRFTYQPTRQTLEMITYYRRSVAVDQMRFVSPDLRLRTILTYQRPEDGIPPTVIDLVGFGVERKQPLR